MQAASFPCSKPPPLCTKRRATQDGRTRTPRASTPSWSSTRPVGDTPYGGACPARGSPTPDVELDELGVGEELGSWSFEAVAPVHEDVGPVGVAERPTGVLLDDEHGWSRRLDGEDVGPHLVDDLGREAGGRL